MYLYRVKGYYSTVSETVGEIVQSTANENLQAMGNNAAGVSKTLSNHKRLFLAIQETLKSTWKTAANTNPQKRPIFN